MTSNQKKQYSLFEDLPHQEKTNSSSKSEEPVKLNGLKLSKNDTKKESKLKKLISYRLKRIKELNSLYEKDKASVQKIKDLYQENLSSDIENYCEVLQKYNEKLIKRYGQKSFANYQRSLLEYLIEENFDEIYSKGQMNEETNKLIDTYNNLKQKYNGYNDVNLEEEDVDWDDEDFDDDEFFNDNDDQFAKQLIKQMLNDIGLEVDDEFFDDLNPNDPNFEDKFQERLFEYTENQKNTEKAEKNRNKVITTDKEFTKLYKSLVKKIHPDLTTDETERQRREVLMKELSLAWEERDYYQLLLLQAEIEPEFNGGMALNKNHLQQIADHLFEKMNEIESQRFVFKRNPDNEFYLKNFFSRSERKILLHIENYKQKLKKEKQDITKNFQKLKNQNTTKAFLKEVDDMLEEEDYGDFWY